ETATSFRCPNRPKLQRGIHPKDGTVRFDLERQSKFNQEIIDIIRPIIDLVLEGNIRDGLTKAVALLTARNELLIVADGDVSVFAFYDQHKKAEIPS
ncbi:hypothetical protein V3C99_008690, partial [Haemonchus contortus]